MDCFKRSRGTKRRHTLTQSNKQQWLITAALCITILAVCGGYAWFLLHPRDIPEQFIEAQGAFYTYALMLEEGAIERTYLGSIPDFEIVIERELRQGDALLAQDTYSETIDLPTEFTAGPVWVHQDSPWLNVVFSGQAQEWVRWHIDDGTERLYGMYAYEQSGEVSLVPDDRGFYPGRVVEPIYRYYLPYVLFGGSN
jgi:hypothetical protein